MKLAVGGCAFKDREDAGNLEFDWLEVQLKGFRARGMQVRCMACTLDQHVIKLLLQVWLSGTCLRSN